MSATVAELRDGRVFTPRDGMLGSSIRRRRWGGKGRGSGRGAEEDLDEYSAPGPRWRPRGRRRRGKRRPRRPGCLAGWLRAAGTALGVAAGGLGLGYLVAVTILFPVSDAPVELQAVPDLRGRSLTVAVAVLADSGLAAAPVDSVRHPVAPVGQVIGQSPLPGLTALPAAPIRLTVSSGREVRPVPDLTRLDGERAAELLVAGGFLVTVDTVESTAPAGRILGIEPEPGSELELPAGVHLTVSLGPPTLPMPDLAGLSLGEAFALLRSHGLFLGEVERRFSLLNVGRVFGQIPEVGEEVVAGIRVRLTIGQQIRPFRELPERDPSPRDPPQRDPFQPNPPQRDLFPRDPPQPHAPQPDLPQPGPSPRDRSPGESPRPEEPR